MNTKSKAARIVALTVLGASTKQIMEEVGTTRTYIYAVRSDWRRKQRGEHKRRPSRAQRQPAAQPSLFRRLLSAIGLLK